ncbi:MAG: hypothetical protein J6A84_01385 [Clostridia bacterium]|nr:hypothetical protein [Clostridia bacterium]
MDRDTKSKRARGLFDFLRARGKLWLLVGGVIVGVFLLLLGSGIGTQSKETGTLTDETAVYENAADLAAYQKELEKELAALCQSVAGVGQADVMVTLGSGRRVVYVTDENGEVATTGTGSAQRAVYRTVQPPTVVGVGVVCKGGDNPHVQRALTDLISTTLGITTNRVFVAGK